MKILEANLVVIFWAVIFGEVIGYIGSQLELMNYVPMQIGIVATIAALIFTNGVKLVSNSDTKTNN
ncbi:YjzD family protein [Secundilactobacillus hailunensis]|uniref:YjzD family protein n=1 Tax=Secundilactobacillus hailunensis TaxID=2559923 RepID=A0ABW1T5W8_9LACO|nr:YjzD family protein [Secundilactobacillus hailunensis]